MKKSLDRFLIAQQNYYHDAYEELKVGKKRSHWMWFIFPQIRGLGYSNMAIYYAIESREEAENYITDPTLGHNLIEISTVLLEIKDNDAKKVMGEPDDRKLQPEIEKHNMQVSKMHVILFIKNTSATPYFTFLSRQNSHVLPPVTPAAHPAQY